MRLPTLRGAVIAGRFSAMKAERPMMSDHYLFSLALREAYN